MKSYSLTFPHLCLFLDELEGIVFRTDTRELIRLDGISVWLLLSLDSGENFEYLKHQLSKKAPIDHTRATQLLGDLAALVKPRKTIHSYAQGRYPELQSLPVEMDQSHCQINISVAKVAFAISTTHHELYKQLVLLFSPIENALNSTDVSVYIKQVGSSFHIIVNGLLVQEVQDFAEVMPELLDRIQVLAYQFHPYYFCFHGAGVETKEGLLLIPGMSGAGKSTASALLCANNGALFSDEMLVLDTQFNLIPITLPIAVKSGSWQCLKVHYPELEKSFVWRRLDGRQLKYIWPKVFARPRSAMKNCMIINPNFVSISASQRDVSCDIGISQQPMSIIDTMQAMTESGYQVGVELNQNLLESWFHLLQSAQRYRLNFDETVSVIDLIEDLWRLKTH